MAEVHDEMDKVLKKYGFRDHRTRKKLFRHDWVKPKLDGSRTIRWYGVNFEGYAYVLYQSEHLYLQPVRFLLWLSNLIYKHKPEKQIALSYSLPIQHFRDATKMDMFLTLLFDETDFEEDEEENGTDNISIIGSN